jgi:hypothetical protein
MRTVFLAAVTLASLCFAQGERPRKESFVPAPEPALVRPKAAPAAPSLTHSPERRTIEKLTHEKRQEMIRTLETLIMITRLQERSNDQT